MIKIPFKLADGIILVPVTANGKAGFFAFDTGAMQTAVNKAHLPEMQGQQVQIAKFTEGVQESSAAEGTLSTLRFSEIELADLPVLIMDLMYVENALKSVMPDLLFLGTLGIDVIRNYAVLLDYQASEITLDPEHGLKHQEAIPMSCDKLPIIQVEAAGRTCDFVLDTGASFCLLGQGFQDNPQLLPAPEAPHMVTVPTVRVGEREYKDITATVTNITAIQKKVPVEGVIGYQILSPQRSILDFKSNQLLLEKT